MLSRLRSTIALVVLLGSLLSLSSYAQNVGPVDAAEREALLKSLFEKRNQAMTANDLETAIRVLRQIIAIDPTNHRALYNMAIIHFMRGRYDKGLPLIGRSVELSPKNIPMREAYARALRESGFIDEAMAQYRAILEQTAPDSKLFIEANRQLKLMLFNGAVAKGDKQGITDFGSELVSSFTGDPAILYQVGSAAAEASIFDLAERAFVNLVKVVPNNGAARFYLANVYESTDRNDEAEREFKRALELKPKPAIAKAAEVKYRTLVGLRLLNNDDVILSRQEFEAVVEMDPNHVVANMNLGLIYIEADELEQAAKAFEKVRSVRPDELEARIRLATIYLDIARAVDGVRELDYVVSVNPQGSYGQRASAILQALEQRVGPERLASMRQFIRASSKLENTLAESPDDTEALINMGDLLLREQKAEEAIALFNKIIEIDPSHLEARIKLGALSEEREKFEESAEHYATALSQMEDGEKLVQIRQRLWTVQAKLYMNQKNFEGAEKAFLDVLSVSEDSLPTLWGLARLKTALGQLEEAVEWYEKFLEYNPKNINAKLNAARLYERLAEEEKALTYYRVISIDIDANETTKKMAEKRIDVLQRQINGFGYSLGYSLNLDDNTTLSENDKSFDYSSNTSLRLDYNYKIRKGLKFKFVFSPTYQVYHVGQYDYLTLDFNPSLLIDKGEWRYDVGFRRNNQYGVLRSDNSVTRSDIYMFNGTWRKDDFTVYQSNASFHTFASQSNPIFDANTLNLGISAYKRREDGSSYNYGYSLTWKDNNHDFGNDYAYVGHAINLGANKRFGAAKSGFVSLGAGYNAYSNPDSSSGADKIKRQNVNIQAQVGGSYRFDDRFSFSVAYSFYYQRSTLPVGIGRLTQVQAIEQATSLGTYQRNTINLSMRVSF